MNPIIPTHPHTPSFEQNIWLIYGKSETTLWSGSKDVLNFILQHWGTFEKLEKYAQETNLKLVITRDWNYWDFTISFCDPLWKSTSHISLRVSHDRNIYIGDGNKRWRKATIEEVLSELKWNQETSALQIQLDSEDTIHPFSQIKILLS